MSHSVTRLIVGEPFEIGLGRPVAQRHAEASTPESLHWLNGAWVPAAAAAAAAIPAAPLHREVEPLAQESVARPRTTSTMRITRFLPGRRTGWAIAALASVVVGAGFVVALTGGALDLPRRAAAAIPAPLPKPLPIAQAPAPDKVGAVRIVSGPYAPESEATSAAIAASGAAPLPPLGPLGRADGSLPIAIPPALAASNVSANRLPAHTPAKAKESQAGQVRPPAVVLDEVAPAASPARPASATASAAKGPVAIKAEPAAKQPPIPRGTGLVAITPDGKVAVFTNPKTRLPVQYKVGDQLPGGDAIRLINLKEGKVVTTTKEYSLD